MAHIEQLNLFQERVIIAKPRYYKDLNINERINVKANSLIFAQVFIYQLRPGYDKMSIITRYEHPEGLVWNKLIQHRKLNSTSIDTIISNKKRRELLAL